MADDNSQPVAVIARLLDLTEQRVQQLAKQGIIPKTERGRYPLVGTVRAYIQYLRDRTVAGETGVTELADERKRLLKAHADKAEMETNQLRGSLVDVPFVRELIASEYSLVRQRVLAMADKLVPLMRTMTDETEIRQTIMAEAEGALNELADDAELRSKIEDTSRPVNVSPPTTETASEPVGG